MSQEIQLSDEIQKELLEIYDVDINEFKKRTSEILKTKQDHLNIMKLANNNEPNNNELTVEIFCNSLHNIMNAALAQKIFTCIDDDQDGKITIVAFHRFMEQKHRYDSQFAQTSLVVDERWLLNQLKQIDMKDLDKDGKGKIELAEMKLFFAKYGVHEEIITQVFDEIDTKKYGYITPMEYFLWKDQCNLKKLRHIVSKTVNLRSLLLNDPQIQNELMTNDTNDDELNSDESFEMVEQAQVKDSTEKKVNTESQTTSNTNNNAHMTVNTDPNATHQRQNTGMREIQYALADEKYERILVEDQKKKLEYQLADETYEKIQKVHETKSLQYELAEERLARLKEEEHKKSLEYQLAEEKLEKFDKEFETKRFQYELADERLERIKLAAEKDQLKQELEKLRHELSKERNEKIELKRKLSSAEMGETNEEALQRELNHQLSLRIEQAPMLPGESPEFASRAAPGLDEKKGALPQMPSEEHTIAPLYEELQRERSAKLNLEQEKQSLEEESKRLQYQLAEEKMKAIEIERQHSFVSDEKKKLEFQLADERMEKIDLVRKFSRPSTEKEEVDKLSGVLEQERAKRKEVEHSVQKLQRRMSEMGIDLTETGNTPFDFELESPYTEQEILQLQKELQEEKQRRTQVEMEKGELINSLAEWETRYSTLQNQIRPDNSGEDLYGTVNQEDYDRLQRESKLMQEELARLREMDQAEGTLTYAQLLERVETLEIDNSQLRREHEEAVKKKLELQEQVESERVRSSTLTRRLSVANQISVNKLLQYANSSPALGSTPNVPVFRNKLRLVSDTHDESPSNDKDGVPPPPSYPPPDVVISQLDGSQTLLPKNGNMSATEDLEDQIRVLQTQNRTLKDKIDSLIQYHKRRDVLSERPLIHVRLLSEFIRALPNKHKEKIYERYSGRKEMRPSGQVFNILFSFLAMAIRTRDTNAVTPQRVRYGERLQPYVSYIVENYLRNGTLMTLNQVINDLPQWLVEVDATVGGISDKQQKELEKEVSLLRDWLKKTEREKERIRRESVSLQAQLTAMTRAREEHIKSNGHNSDDSIDDIYKTSQTLGSEERLKARIDKLELDLADEKHEKAKIQENSRKSMWQLESQVKQLQEEIKHQKSNTLEKIPTIPEEISENENEDGKKNNNIQKKNNKETEVDLRDEKTWAEERLEFEKNEENLMKNELYIGWKKKAEAYKEELQKQKTQMRERENSIMSLMKWKEEAERLHHIEEENNQYKDQLDNLTQQLAQFQKSHEGRKVRAQSIYQLHSDVSNTLEQSKIHHESIIEKYKEDINSLHMRLSEYQDKTDVLEKEKHELLSLLNKLSEEKNTEEQIRQELLRDNTTLQAQVNFMERNKLSIVQTTADTIESLRTDIRKLSSRLRAYETRG